MKYIRFKDYTTLILLAMFVQICLSVIENKVEARPLVNLCAKFFYEMPSRIVLLNADELIVDRTIQERVEFVIEKGDQPIVIFDLEGTLYLTQSRILTILKKYDRQHNTTYFDGMTTDRIDPEASFSFIRWAVSQKEFNVRIKDRVTEEIIQFFKMERNKISNLKYDEVFDKTRYLAQMYHRLGARVIIVTERGEFAKDATTKQLQKDGIPFDEIFFRSGSQEKPDIIKLAQVEDLNRRDGSKVVAFFEDTQPLHDFAGEMRNYDMYQVFVKTRFQDKTFRFYNPIR